MLLSRDSRRLAFVSFGNRSIILSVGELAGR